MSELIQIQANFAGFEGLPCSLFSAYDSDNRVLIIAKEANYRELRRDGCALISNIDGSERDFFFTDKQIFTAIEAYFSLLNGVSGDGKSSRLMFSADAARANPNLILEKDGIDSGGQKFRVSEGATCGQMAALATCLFAQHYEKIDRVIDASSFYSQLALGRVVTI